MAKYSEITLKGQNRSTFEQALIANIRACLACPVNISHSQATIYIEPQDSDPSGNVHNSLLRKLTCVPGISSLAIAKSCEKDMDAICACAIEVMRTSKAKTYKAEAKRADKKFPLNSPQISAAVGFAVGQAFPALSVDVHTPDVTINVDIRETAAYVYAEKIKGLDGMPVGTGGHGLLMLSGGIDSPVAGFMMAKRGVKLSAIHFYSYPYTSERAKDKVISLAKIISRYAMSFSLHIVPFTEIQLAIRDKCSRDMSTILMRRFMMRIVNAVASREGCGAIITGESLGQVASQTMDAIAVTDALAEKPVFRPLIGMNKEEIVNISRAIDAFETSTLPYEDCCTVFTPKHPVTKPKLPKVEVEEAKLDVEALVAAAVEGIEVLEV